MKKVKQETSIRTVQVGEETVTYHATKKNVKNINMRIKPDGNIHISSPHHISLEYVDNFVQRNEEFILKALEKFRNTKSNKGNALLDNNIIYHRKTLYLLGYEYIVNITPASTDHIQMDRETKHLNIHTVYPQNEQKIQKNVDKWIKKYGLMMFSSIAKEFYPQFEKYGIPYPEIKTRKMKARWGSCSYSKKIITFADMLLYVPVEFIEYVVVHEFAHLIEPNHSKNFYRIVEEIMPDWKERKQRLKTFMTLAEE